MLYATLVIVVEAAVVPSHRRRNSHRDIAVWCGLRFDLADDAVFFGEEKRPTVRKVEQLFLRSRVEQGEIPSQRRSDKMTTRKG